MFSLFLFRSFFLLVYFFPVLFLVNCLSCILFLLQILSSIIIILPFAFILSYVCFYCFIFFFVRSFSFSCPSNPLLISSHSSASWLHGFMAAIPTIFRLKYWLGRIFVFGKRGFKLEWSLKIQKRFCFSSLGSAFVAKPSDVLRVDACHALSACSTSFNLRHWIESCSKYNQL